MILSEPEKKSLQKLQTVRRQWRKVRWFSLAMGMLLLGLSAFQHLETRKLSGVLELVLADQVKMHLVDRLVSMAIVTRLSLWAGVFLVVFTLARWRGSPIHLLLLRLFEERAEE